MKIDTSGLMAVDYRVSLHLSHGRKPSGVNIDCKTQDLKTTVVSALINAGIGCYPYDNSPRVMVHVIPYPAEALAERIAASLESDGKTVERTIVEPCSTNHQPIQSLLMY